jgi:hypothetical protein
VTPGARDGACEQQGRDLVGEEDGPVALEGEVQPEERAADEEHDDRDQTESALAHQPVSRLARA